jgi:hypothetical protein
LLAFVGGREVLVHERNDHFDQIAGLGDGEMHFVVVVSFPPGVPADMADTEELFESLASVSIDGAKLNSEDELLRAL